MISNKVRIIGGRWRGRKLPFPDVPGLRPTADRVRETLFNWLSPHINGAHCLDLFAGSGALGFEAASRGAAKVLMIDNDRAVIQQLKANQTLLNAQNVTIYQAAIPESSSLPEKPFDLVFLDPPFHKNLINQACQWLIHHHYLAKQALIYLETEATLTPLPIPQTWEILKAKKTSQVNYYLIKANDSIE
ncbi:MAG: rsmD [Gammaproteobacteria bacterium]|jgi:16S rRNA (guanine966-N2)-methyltransferase|nr:rsmD [Gammaproteobacteria bacterium]